MRIGVPATSRTRASTSSPAAASSRGSWSGIRIGRCGNATSPGSRPRSPRWRRNYAGAALSRVIPASGAGLFGEPGALSPLPLCRGRARGTHEGGEDDAPPVGAACVLQPKPRTLAKMPTRSARPGGGVCRVRRRPPPPGTPSDLVRLSEREVRGASAAQARGIPSSPLVVSLALPATQGEGSVWRLLVHPFARPVLGYGLRPNPTYARIVYVGGLRRRGRQHGGPADALAVRAADLTRIYRTHPSSTRASRSNAVTGACVMVTATATLRASRNSQNLRLAGEIRCWRLPPGGWRWCSHPF